MNADPPILTMLVLAVGLTAFAILTVFAVRRGGQIQDTWRKLAMARGWRCEQPDAPGVSIRLHGHTQDMAWTCSLVHAPAVNTSQTVGKGGPLETLWRTQLPGESVDGYLNLYDAESFRRLRRAADSPLMDVMAHASPGLAGNALAAGIASARAPSTPIGANHMAIATGDAMQRLIDSDWERAFQRFVSENAHPQLRIFIDAHKLEIALLGSIKETERLERFITSCVRLAEATRRYFAMASQGNALPS